ncbi:MAG TPA: LLM class flavin-dependent oxidoreductase [Acidimicrobiales bacterium]|nr:LLM class flavin-dependent oxidoreductase [Acidimicrobiales bacterium]
MKFGIFFELSVPRPWDDGAEKAVYDNALEQARLADELGFDWVWAVEHHFLEEYSHCSAPEVFLAAVAAQTERIRVGHGVVVCVPQMNHPIRLAERAAVLDVISNGRLEFGTGRSSTWTELGGFQADPDETKKTWDEYVRAIPKMWTQERFSYEGRSFSMPERAVLPKPIQKPHPPMWVAVTSPGTELDAAERGLGCIGLAAAGYAEQERRTAEYHRRIQSCDPVGEVVTDCVTTLNFLYCHEDAAVARDRGVAFQAAFGVSNAHLHAGGVSVVGLRAAGRAGGAGAAVVGGEPGGAQRPARGRGHRRSRLGGRPDQGVGVDRRRRHQLPHQRHGDADAGRGAGLDAAVRIGSDAQVPVRAR